MSEDHLDFQCTIFAGPPTWRIPSRNGIGTPRVLHLFAVRADIAVGLIIPRKVSSGERAGSALAFFKHRDERQNLAFECQPNKIVGRPVGRICGYPIWLQAKPLFGLVNHLAHGTNFSGPVRAAGIHVNDDTVIRIDQIIGGIRKECRTFTCGGPLAGRIGMSRKLGLGRGGRTEGFAMQRGAVVSNM